MKKEVFFVIVVLVTILSVNAIASETYDAYIEALSNDAWAVAAYPYQNKDDYRFTKDKDTFLYWFDILASYYDYIQLQ